MKEIYVEEAYAKITNEYGDFYKPDDIDRYETFVDMYGDDGGFYGTVTEILSDFVRYLKQYTGIELSKLEDVESWTYSYETQSIVSEFYLRNDYTVLPHKEHLELMNKDDCSWKVINASIRVRVVDIHEGFTESELDEAGIL